MSPSLNAAATAVAPRTDSAAVAELDMPVDPAGWTRWLAERLDPDWRTGEWAPRWWLFTGEVDNPATLIFRCSSTGCGYWSESPTRPCGSCLSGRRPDVGLVRQERSMGLRVWCSVVRAGQRCERDAVARRLCMAHDGMWQRHQQRTAGADFTVWATSIATPLAAHGPCAAAGCPFDSVSKLAVLCAVHRSRYDAARRAGATQPVATWAERQAPRLGPHQFSLAPLADVVRYELLYGLQQRDRRGGVMALYTMRGVVASLTGVASLLQINHGGAGSGNRVHVINESLSWVRAAHREFRGLAAGSDGTLDLLTVGVRSTKTRSGRRMRGGTASLEAISQRWLRDLLVAWVRAVQPSSDVFGAMLKSTKLVSAALTQRPSGGHEPATLTSADMDAVVQACASACQPDGTPYAYATRKQRRRMFLDLLEFGHREGLLDALSTKFTVHQLHHKMPRTIDQEEDEAGKAIPEHVIRQLDDHLDTFGAEVVYGRLAPDDVRWLLRTAYIVCRDTGRRPREFCSLRSDCLKYDDGEYQLVWDNRKGRRLKRVLPIERGTADAITAWRARREQLSFPAHTDGYLFPAIGTVAKHQHLPTETFSRAMRRWVTGIPAIHSDAPGPDGTPLPFDRTRIYPYAFRSSYAQRHADAGTDLDVLMTLMDHVNPATTMGYYRVTIKRKRQAVETLRLHSIDRTGHAAPFTSGTSYEAKSVAVPYGNCVEPSNVKAGGQRCPIRFQCAGCGFYRPDPSYLPAIEDHVRALKADRELADVMDVDDFVVRNLTDQITAFQTVISRMNTHLQKLPDDVRTEIEEASKVLRRARAGTRPTLLPLTVLPHSSRPAAERS